MRTMAERADYLVQQATARFWKTYSHLMAVASEGGRTPGIAKPTPSRMKGVWDAANPYQRRNLLTQFPDEFAGLAGEPDEGDIHREVETELTVEVRMPAMLSPDKGRVWKFLQAYAPEPGGEESVRIIPACNQAFIRHKYPAMALSRYKVYHEVPYAKGEAELRKIANVAVKDRFFHTEGGHMWVVSRFPEFGLVEAETNIDSPQDMQQLMQSLPPWAGQPLHDQAAGYTSHYARPRSQAEISSLIQDAQKGGCSEHYDPSYAANPGKGGHS